MWLNPFEILMITVFREIGMLQRNVIENLSYMHGFLICKKKSQLIRFCVVYCIVSSDLTCKWTRHIKQRSSISQALIGFTTALCTRPIYVQVRYCKLFNLNLILFACLFISSSVIHSPQQQSLITIIELEWLKLCHSIFITLRTWLRVNVKIHSIVCYIQ